MVNLRDGATWIRLSRLAESVVVEAGGDWFSARTDVPYEPGEMATVAAALSELDAARAGAYRFVPMANWGEIVFAMAKKGELHISVRLQSAPDYLNEVRLFLNLRQDALPSIAGGFAGLEP